MLRRSAALHVSEMPARKSPNTPPRRSANPLHQPDVSPRLPFVEKRCSLPGSIASGALPSAARIAMRKASMGSHIGQPSTVEQPLRPCGREAPDRSEHDQALDRAPGLPAARSCARIAKAHSMSLCLIPLDARLLAGVVTSGRDWPRRRCAALVCSRHGSRSRLRSKPRGQVAGPNASATRAEPDQARKRRVVLRAAIQRRLRHAGDCGSGLHSQQSVGDLRRVQGLRPGCARARLGAGCRGRSS